MLNEKMDIWKHNLREEGHQQGLQQGRNEAFKDLKAIIIRLLELQDPFLIPAVKNHIMNASSNELETLLRKILNNEPIEAPLEAV